MGERLYGMHCNHDAYIGHCPYCHMDLRTSAERKLEADLRDEALRLRVKVQQAIRRHKKIKVRRTKS